MNELFPLNHFLNIPPCSSRHGLQETESFGPRLLPLPQKKSFDAEELHLIDKKIREHLKDQIAEAKYNTFFHNTFSLFSLTANAITFRAATEYIQTMIKNNYLDNIQEAIQFVLGKKYKIEISVLFSNQGFSSNQKNIQNTTNLSKDEAPLERGPVKDDIKKVSAKDASFTIDLIPTKADKLSSIESKVINHPNSTRQKFKFIVDPQKTFESFVVGPSNNMAHASAQAIAKKPGKVYPSLYLHSHSGLGKTHLLHSVANVVKYLHPDLAISIITARDFMTEMVDAVANKNLFKFRKKYSEDIDVLMIDDIHELKNRPGTQNEFFHVFNEFHNKGKQLIFTSDKHPKDIDGIEERIKTRLTWGLVLDIQPPDLETRIAILKNKAAQEDIFLPEDVTNLIATRIRSSIRELEGALIRLAAYSSIFDIGIDIEITKEQLNLTDNREQDSLTIEDIAKTASVHFKVPLADIKSKSRLKVLTKARHSAMFLSHTLIQPAPTYMEIGNFFGGRDHTSVLHAIKKVRMTLKTDHQFSQDLLEIENTL